jgi:hypothetical protein
MVIECVWKKAECVIVELLSTLNVLLPVLASMWFVEAFLNCLPVVDN